MKRLSILLFLLLTSCGLYEREVKNTHLTITDTVKEVDFRLYMGVIVPDTIVRQLRDYKVENHLLRIEIDALKSKIKRIRKLQKIDSILNNEIE